MVKKNTYKRCSKCGRFIGKGIWDYMIHDRNCPKKPLYIWKENEMGPIIVGEHGYATFQEALKDEITRLSKWRDDLMADYNDKENIKSHTRLIIKNTDI
jgi:hypothetical protein